MASSPKSLARVVALAALLVLAAVAPAAALSSSTYESQVITRTNHYRDAHDKVALKPQSCADRWAEGQARWMAAHQKLQHRSGRLEKIMDDCGFTSAAENIAYGFSSGNRTVDGWMQSSGHRANILRSKSRYIGVGAVKDDNGVWWVSQVFGAR